ncbi:bifunctional diaminohydroxyphosphoribosylaminopyrimidine deaminase/5-amino-6-(5-phosphoribosylamino)uracil reductase RibD [Asticcacaulis sp. ZE23SCel15]|uniref:bifunctional diaminohydroxyphosphoribosylaminopyrimidine deaminase/5-amino-6-(5-phosphoribosylamino)uracil reductase RibD n=1 Tax=Asticcacaulis sp. ZE23SCel15 TaxID=3059027 RepID=UPI0026600730|nr:bifunctional diaminohydroxyphosphoribosylaminopyrimidine deaminase/5-amino-6-(5-phosphoribosylamino)uracil reductase RibD [Asticcacaulis sp. ZE23SCel15]WKL59005.1 bifunctional diaminohydroxyphosphoribosylaminopyrimidine deaminase/5-amino-6-(5-phosphoribosylamino)uracil reductase RibD [Asticcacaulis sp. ZE23SCel15]
MRRAIALARPGTTWPNPAVGCVIVKDGAVVGEGFTGSGGRPHAEEMALEQAGDVAHGATAYVTLEPCGQRSAGGVSCSEKLVAAGVVRVIFACPDPSPFAAHTGVHRLQNAGVEVEAGLLNDEAYPLIAGFVHFLETGRPRIAESHGGTGFDGEYEPDPCISYEEGLAALGLKGYRNLFVRPGTEVAKALHELGYLSEGSAFKA